MSAVTKKVRDVESRFLAIVTRQYFQKWIPLSIIIGIAAGLSAIAFYEMLRQATAFFLKGIAGYYPPAPAGEREAFFKFSENPLLIPLVTCIGGLISGLLVYSFAPEAEGHGTDAAIDAFHNKQGEIRSRVPLVKMIASAVTIGSGGSAGREGPIALTSAGVASIVGSFFKLTGRDRRIAIAAGIGSGIGAIFKAPFGGAILAAEILYLHDFEVEALVPSFIASVVGYSIFSSVYGWQPIFEGGGEYVFIDPLSLLFYGFLGVLCGLIGIIYVKSFYGAKELFDKLRIPPVFKPAVGGLLLGLIAIWVPQVLGTGYGWLQKVILGDFTAIPLYLVFALIFLKILATSLTVGSGGSGGVFAPALTIGGMTGAATWIIFKLLGIISESSPAPYVIVGMMAFFGGVGKVPIAVILMVSEMTGSYELLPAAMVSSVLAYMLLGEDTIYHEQVPTRADSPAHLREYEIGLLGKLKVRDAMKDEIPIVKPTSTLEETLEIMEKFDTKWAIVVDKSELLGILTVEDIFMLPPDKRKDSHVKEVMTTNLVVTYEDETLMNALRKMILQGVGQLPVVDRNNPKKLKGAITRCDVLEVYEDKLGKIVNEEL